MNGRLGDIDIQPDQVQALNPILILVFIPIFEFIIYPIFAKCNLLKKPLQRIVAGMILAGLAFVVAGVVQLEIQASDQRLKGGEAKAVVTNGLPESLQMQILNGSEFSRMFGESYEFKTSNLRDYTLRVTRSNNEAADFPFTLSNKHVYQIVVSNTTNGSLGFAYSNHKESIPEGGEANVQVINAAPTDQYINFTLCDKSSCKESEFSSKRLEPLQASNFSDVDVGSYYYKIENSSGQESQLSKLSSRLEAGGIYTLVVTENGDRYQVTVVEVDQPNKVSIFLQVPMYVVITAGEVMFSITGLEFAYSQAPVSMKAISQAAWLWTVAFGNLFVVIVAEGSLFSNQAVEFFFFAGCIVVLAILFSIMAYFYTYVDLSKRDLEEDDLTSQHHDESSSLVLSQQSSGEDRRKIYSSGNTNGVLSGEDKDLSESEL